METLDDQERFTEITVFSQESIPAVEAAQEISNIFRRNYPEMYSEAQRSADLSRYATPEQIQQQVKDGNVYSIATLHNKVIGFLKTRIENRDSIPDAEEWLGAWLMIDKPYRRSRVGEKLLNERFDFFRKRKQQSGKRVFFIGDIHRDNVPSRNLLAKLGCNEELGKSAEYVLIRKEF